MEASDEIQTSPEAFFHGLTCRDFRDFKDLKELNEAFAKKAQRTGEQEDRGGETRVRQVGRSSEQ